MALLCNKTFKYTKEYKSDGYCSYNCKRSDNLIKEFNLNEEDFAKLKTNYNIPSLGKLTCTYERMLGVKKRFNFIKQIRKR